MFGKLFERLRMKNTARQLRKPHGAFGQQVGLMMNRSNEPLYDFTLEVMQPAYYQSILEIGFGNGKFFEKLIAKAEGLNISGIDYSETMVEAASRANDELLRDGRLKLSNGNSDKLPFADNSFDKVYCINVAYFWDKPQDHLNEVKRVLKPRGRFYVTVRTKDSLEMMPFTKYGFRGYSSEDWKQLSEAAGMNFLTAEIFEEPPFEQKGRKLSFRSYCFVTEKPQL